MKKNFVVGFVTKLSFFCKISSKCHGSKTGGHPQTLENLEILGKGVVFELTWKAWKQSFQLVFPAKPGKYLLIVTS